MRALCFMRSSSLWAFIFMACVGFISGEGWHHSGRHLNRERPNLDDLLNRLDASIQELNQGLQNGLHTLQYNTDLAAEDDEKDRTIIHGFWDEETTQLENPMEDLSDYVNAAPWTRKRFQEHDLQQIKLASDNARRVKDSGKCQVPLRRCVPLASQHPSYARSHWPRCALLHRCGDDAGCCYSLDHTCAMAESENVDLYFYVIDNTRTGRAGVQKMTFANHTRCSCQPTSVVALQEANNLGTKCKCPKHFLAVYSRGICACNCPEGKSTCRKYKRGKRYLSEIDIECISNGECSVPTCEYGPFVHRKRRCTKRRERERYTTNRK